MLLEMTIAQFALIDQVRIQFGPGLNVLTGETGAGKSIVLDALQAALGGRVPADVVRTGADRATVEAVFDVSGQPDRLAALAQMGVEVAEDGLLVVRREIHRSGKGRVYLNGRSVTTGMLREAAAGLADLHGQHEHQTLLQADRHLDLLDQYGGLLLNQEGRALDVIDAYAGGPILALRAEVAVVVRELQEVAQALADLGGDPRERQRREDLLRYQLQELEGARLRPGEEEELEAQLRVLAAADRLQRTAAEAHALLYEGQARQPSAYDILGRVQALVADAARTDPALAPVLDLLATAQAHIQEAAHFLADYRDRVEADPDRLAAVERRLDQIQSLKRKYGDTVAEMLRYLEEVRAELHRLETSEEQAAALRRRQEELGRRAEDLAARLSAARQEAAAELGARVARELADLGMAGAQFVVRVEPPAQPSYKVVGPKGWDRVEFLFSPNVGEPPKPLARIVSGGEMSRIMLALKVILARVDNVPTLVFDEVDAGISGRTAQAVAEKLATIAQDRQVLCVTHLPQVAAMADTHFRIHKEVSGGRTVTRVEPLDEEGRTLEVARLIGGAELTRATLEAARELVRQAGGRRAHG